MDQHANELRFAEYLQPIILALKKYNVNVSFTSRNDLMVNGYKISGSAQFIKNENILHHGTFLINENLKVLQEVLSPKKKGISSIGNKSNPSKVTNFSTVVGELIDIEEIKALFRNAFCNEKAFLQIELSNLDLKQIDKLVKTKYKTWEWNYGVSPDFSIKRKKRMTGGTVEVMMNVVHSQIQDIRFYGDFFCAKDISVLESEMIGVRVDQSLYERLNELGAGSYIYGVTADDLAKLILEE